MRICIAKIRIMSIKINESLTLSPEEFQKIHPDFLDKQLGILLPDGSINITDYTCRNIHELLAILCLDSLATLKA